MAFKVEVSDFPAGTCVVRTTTAKRAKFLAWQSAQEAGYDFSFARFKVTRCPEGDREKLRPGRCYGPDYLDD